jgi:hypothetical protein
MKKIKATLRILVNRLANIGIKGATPLVVFGIIRKAAKQHKAATLHAMSTGVVIAIAFLLTIFAQPGSASAFGLFGQDDWSGGIGANSNQYAGISGLDTSVGGELRLDTSSGPHGWCSTPNCDGSWDRRMAVHFTRPDDNSTYTDGNVQVTVQKTSTMQDDFGDLRFVNKAGTTDLPHYVVEKSDGEWATVLVHFATYPSDNESIYVYYGNSGASDVSDASLLTINGDFKYLTKHADYLSKWGGNGSATGQFNNPKGLAQDNNGNIYVADTGNHRIQKFDANGTFISAWGTQGSGDNQFESPVGITYDSGTAHVFVVDSTLNRVQEFNPQGLFIKKFGVAGTAPGQLNNPQGIAVCASGDIYVANTGNHRVEWYNKSSGAHYGSGGGYGSGDTELDSPAGVSIAPDQFNSDPCRIAVADTGNSRIAWFGSDLTPGSQADPQNLMPAGSLGSGPGQLDHPTGIWFDNAAQTAYVADTGNHRIQSFNTSGKYFGEWGEQGTQDGQFTSLVYVIGTAQDKAWTLDRDTGRVQVFEHTNLAYRYSSHYGYEVSNEGDVMLTRPSNSWFGPSSGPDRSVNRVSEVELTQDPGSMGCGDSQFAFALQITGQVYLRFDNRCENSQRYIHPYEYYNGYADAGYNLPGDVRIPTNTAVRLRVINYANNENSVSYSVDGGRSYTFIAENPFINSDPPLPFLNTGDTNFGNYTVVKSMIQYNAGPDDITSTLGIEEYYGGFSGYVESRVIDLETTRTSFGNIYIDSTGSGLVGVYVRTGTSSPSENPYVFCGLLGDGASLSSSDCGGESGARYVQYRLDMSGNYSADLHVQSVSFEYIADLIAPGAVSNLTIQKGQGGAVVAENGWFSGKDVNNGGNPYFSWDAALDNQDGSGIKGYCLYMGTDASADPATTAGTLYDFTQNGYDGISTGDVCRHMTDQTHIAIPDNWDLNYEQTQYFKVYAVDNSGNIQTVPAAQASFRVDTGEPVAYTVMTGPDPGNSKIFSVNFLGTAPAYIGDQGWAGVAGFKYCISQDPYSGFSDCVQGNNWYGPGHSGDGTLSPVGAGAMLEGGFTTTAADADRITDEGANFVILSVIDNAGNTSFILDGQSPFVVAYVTQQPPTVPRSLQVTPSSNTQNLFSFSWVLPQTYIGTSTQINYCYTVNEVIASDGHNCRWTGEGITQLAAGPYATQQGTNTLYLMARDKTQNFSPANATSITFSATTNAPGSPRNLELSDVSVRATNSWKLAMSWAVPTQLGSGVSTYKIMRSTDGVSYSQVGSTSDSNLSFIDAGLSQVMYYYQVKACDNASNCSVVSNTASRKPLGRFTTPASLIVGGGRPVAINIGTRKATVQWQTDRESDSRVAIGTASGQYAPDETGNSAQVTDHSINLSNLQPGTQYYYVAKWTDGDGNTGVSPERSFMTAPAPSVREARAESLTVSSAAIRFITKDASKARVYYGKSDSFGAVEEINTSQAESNYSVVLSGLSDDTKYFFRVATRDSDGNEYEGDTYTFTTPALPKISQLRFSAVEDAPKNTLRVTWLTNQPTNSEISYGLIDGAVIEQSDPGLKTEHELILEGLVDGSTYSLVARSRNAAGDLATSDRNFFTTALDTRPPKVTDVVVETAIRGSGTEARGQITVAWKTDEPSTSQVAFGQGQSGDYTGRTTIDTRLTTEHVVVISDLPTSSIYRVQAIANDTAGNTGRADASSVIIGRGVDNIFSIIFNTLQRIFGL